LRRIKVKKKPGKRRMKVLRVRRSVRNARLRVERRTLRAGDL
jgi:hypothetical protein